MTREQVAAHAAAGTLAAALIREPREPDAYLFDMAWLGLEALYASRPCAPISTPRSDDNDSR